MPPAGSRGLQVLVAIYLISPSASYQFMELVEVRACHTEPSSTCTRSLARPPGAAQRGVAWRADQAAWPPKDASQGPPALSPQGHAADTYTEFAEQNREALQQIPPPLVALNYYKSGDL